MEIRAGERVGIARLVSLAGDLDLRIWRIHDQGELLGPLGRTRLLQGTLWQGSGSFSWFLLWVWGEQTFGPGIVASRMS